MKNQNETNTRPARIVATGEKINVYRLTSGHPTPDHIWNRYLGDEISLSKIEQKQHTQTFTSKELDFIF